MGPAAHAEPAVFAAGTFSGSGTSSPGFPLTVFPGQMWWSFSGVLTAVDDDLLTVRLVASTKDVTATFTLAGPPESLVAGDGRCR